MSISTCWAILFLIVSIGTASHAQVGHSNQDYLKRVDSDGGSSCLCSQDTNLIVAIEDLYHLSTKIGPTPATTTSSAGDDASSDQDSQDPSNQSLSGGLQGSVDGLYDSDSRNSLEFESSLSNLFRGQHRDVNNDESSTSYLNGLFNNLGIGRFNTGNFNVGLNNLLPNLTQSDLSSIIKGTVPMIVTDLFASMQNLTELNELSDLSSEISGNSEDEIIAEAERLFKIWIEVEIKRYKLMGTAATYFRRSGLTLFRRIVVRYMRIVSRFSGNMLNNIRYGNILALDATEQIIAFLLKNYLDSTNGLMRIIGDQVSRVGKSIDSAGQSMKNMTLNPMEIASKVLDSLPDPSRYSNYFRNLTNRATSQSSDGSSSSSVNGYSGLLSSWSSGSGQNGLLSSLTSSLWGNEDNEQQSSDSTDDDGYFTETKVTVHRIPSDGSEDQVNSYSYTSRPRYTSSGFGSLTSTDNNDGANDDGKNDNSQSSSFWFQTYKTGNDQQDSTTTSKPREGLLGNLFGRSSDNLVGKLGLWGR